MDSVLDSEISSDAAKAEYAKGLVLKRKRLEDCFKEEKVQAFLATAEQAKFARKLTIWSFLDAPRSNLPRLKLQVNF